MTQTLFLPIRLALAAGLAVALIAAFPAVVDAQERTNLWDVVHYACGGMTRLFGISLPCLKVDRQAGYAIVRSPADNVRILAVPTRRISGIESPDLQRSETPPYWAYAWANRSFVAQAAPRKLDWGDYAMAVNSRAGRSQDQLHIHVACILPSVKEALAAHPPARSGWSRLELPTWMGEYRMRRIEAADLGRNLFKLVAEDSPGGRGAMVQHALAVVPIGPERAQGFALLDNGHHGHSEGLLDVDCRG
jgi:CDP-diacylglycerol pyrophosphatase